MKDAAVVGLFGRLRRALFGALPGAMPPGAYAVVAGAAVAQGATIVVTRDLWKERATPPNLPLGDWAEPFSRLDWAPLLVVLAAAVVVLPRWAAPVFCGAAALAAAGDQIRLQPEVVSLALLMTAPAFGSAGRAVGRWHLAALWLWAGTHKALSLGWSSEGAVTIAGFLNAEEYRSGVAWALPAMEIALGLLACWPRAWPVVRWGGAALHAGILLTLSPAFGDWNSAVWPWNAALALASLLLFARAEVWLPTVGVRVAAAVLVLVPALFYAGVTDAYLAHNLYSSNGAAASVCAGGRCGPAPFDTWGPLNVPLPPQERLYRRWFNGTCQSGSELVVTGPRTRLSDPPWTRSHPCPRR